MQWLLNFFLEGILGYLLQSVAFTLGMHGFAQQKVDIVRLLLVSAVSAVFALFVRTCGLFNFGVHTMLVLLFVNVCCIFFCKLDIRLSILGSIVMMVLVLLGEVLDVGLLMLLHPQQDIQALLGADRTAKAVAAIPGNLFHLCVSILLYHVRVVRRAAA